MDFDSWTNNAVDRDRRRRLFIGYAFGATTILTTVGVLAMGAKSVIEEVPEEQALDVQLATEPEPEPEPVADPDPTPQPRVAGPVMPVLSTPTEIPEDAPNEKDVDPNANPYASGDPYQFAGQGGTAPRTAQVVVKAEAPKAVVAKESGPLRVTADMTPPKELGQVSSTYPAEAKAAGIQGRVTVKLVVDESGTPTNVRAVAGPAELREACEERFKGAKYSPAIRDGKPVAVQQTKFCNFKLTT